MTASALISGVLHRDPEPKTSGSGKAYTLATVRVADGNERSWWKLLAFDDDARAELALLRNGDALSASGSFKAEPYKKADELRVSYTLFPERVISAKRQKRERGAAQRAQCRNSSQDSWQAPYDREEGLL